MQKRLSSIPAPALAGVIREKTKKAAVAQTKNCLYVGADILNPLLGGQIAFCVERYDEGSTMEQIPLATMRAICDNHKRIIRR